MLSRQSASRPRLAAHRRNRGHDRLSPEDGHARGAEAVSPTQPRDRVLPRLDQKQTGAAPVSPARPGQSANGNALGLPHLQPATMDPTPQTASRNRLTSSATEKSRNSWLKKQTTPPQPLPPTSLFLQRDYLKMVFSQLRSLRKVGDHSPNTKREAILKVL